MRLLLMYKIPPALPDLTSVQKGAEHRIEAVEGSRRATLTGELTRLAWPQAAGMLAGVFQVEGVLWPMKSV